MEEKESENTEEQETGSEEDQLSRGERRRIKRLQAKEERKKERHQESRSAMGKKIMFILAAVVVVGLLGFLFYRMSTGPNYESFAKCLASKDTVLYGNNWCQYTQEQRRMFGSSFQFLNYKVCDENKQLCREKGVSITPTWEINGKMYSGVQSIETLSRASGCSLGE